MSSKRQLRQSRCHGLRILTLLLELDSSILLARPCQLFDTLTTSGRAEREPHRENPAMVVPVELRRGDLHTTPDARWSRSASGKLPSTSLRCQENFLLSIQGTARPKSRICSSIGQTFPFILQSTAVLNTIVRPRRFAPVAGRLAPIVLWMSHGPRPFAPAKVGAKTCGPAHSGECPYGSEPPRRIPRSSRPCLPLPKTPGT